MPMPRVHHAFLQWASPDGCEEASFIDGRVGSIRARRLDRPRVIRRGGALESVKGGAGRLLKYGARLVYLSTILLVVKLVLQKVGEEDLSNLVIVVFVFIVLLFFISLALYIAASVAYWLKGRDKATYALDEPFLAGDRGEAARRLSGDRGNTLDLEAVGAARLPAGQAARTRGVIRRLGPTPEGDGTVLREIWAKDGSLRIVEVIDFAVVGRGQLPAVVRIDDAPLVLATPKTAQLDSYTSQSSPSTMQLIGEVGRTMTIDARLECWELSLREGDEVEVTGAVLEGIDNVDGFDLAGTYASVPLAGREAGDGGTPFRDRPGGPGVILSGSMVIQRLAPR